MHLVTGSSHYGRDSSSQAGGTGITPVSPVSPVSPAVLVESGSLVVLVESGSVVVEPEVVGVGSIVVPDEVPGTSAVVFGESPGQPATNDARSTSDHAEDV